MTGMIIFITALSAINLIFGLAAWAGGSHSMRRNSVENFGGFGCMVAGPIIALIGAAGLVVVFFAGDAKAGFISVFRDIVGAVEFLVAAPVACLVFPFLISKAWKSVIRLFVK